MAKNNVIFKLDKNDSIVKDGHVLYRLICDGYEKKVEDEPYLAVKKGVKGGYIESLNQISTVADNDGAVAWVDENSFAYGDTYVNNFYVYNSTICNSTLNGWCHVGIVENSTIVNSSISGKTRITNSYISDSKVKRFYAKNANIINCDIESRNSPLIYGASLNNINGKFANAITGNYTNELTQYRFHINGDVYICADKQQIAVTYTASNDVHEGIFKPVEFVQLVESKIKQNVKDILEQYI